MGLAHEKKSYLQEKANLFEIGSLNNLAPDIVEAIVEGNEPDGLSIEKISRNIPEDWAEQRKLFGFPAL